MFLIHMNLERRESHFLLSGLSLVPVSRGGLSPGAAGRLCHTFLLQHCVTRGAGFGLTLIEVHLHRG